MHKRGNRKTSELYDHISLLSIFSKICKKIIQIRLVTDYVENIMNKVDKYKISVSTTPKLSTRCTMKGFLQNLNVWVLEIQLTS